MNFRKQLFILTQQNSFFLKRLFSCNIWIVESEAEPSICVMGINQRYLTRNHHGSCSYFKIPWQFRSMRYKFNFYLLSNFFWKHEANQLEVVIFCECFFGKLVQWMWCWMCQNFFLNYVRSWSKTFHSRFFKNFEIYLAGSPFGKPFIGFGLVVTVGDGSYTVLCFKIFWFQNYPSCNLNHTQIFHIY